MDLEQAKEILKNNGVSISSDSIWKEEITGKTYFSNHLEALYIYPDKVKYWEDIRTKKRYITINLI